MTRPSRYALLFAAALLTSSISSLSIQAAPAVEQTEPERLYKQLADSEKAEDKRLGERWQKLVRQRQWANTSGKFKVFARYVSHDVQSVKLLVDVKSGDKHSYKEVTVPLAKLGKAEQTVVKQIDMLRKQVEQAAAGATTPGEGIAGTEGPPVVPQGGPEGQAPPGVVIPGGAAPGSLPPGVVPPGAPGQGPPLMTPLPREHNMPQMPDAAAWRTDFQAFAGNLSAAKGEGGKWDVQFGELGGLKAAYDASYKIGHALAESGPAGAKVGQIFMASQKYSMAVLQVGEVTWQTTISAPIAPGADGIKHDLKLPEPLGISLVVDDGDAGDFSRFKAGDRVRFIGRFYDLGGAGETPHFTLHVRFPDEQAAAGPEQGSAAATDAEMRKQRMRRGP